MARIPAHVKRDIEKRITAGTLVPIDRTAPKRSRVLEPELKAAPVSLPSVPLERKARPVGIRARGRHVPGVMNRYEAAYAEILFGLRLAGEISEYWFEEMRLKVGVKSWYTPDFHVIRPDGAIYLVEVKAFSINAAGEVYKVINEDAREKVASCALRHSFPILMAFGRKTDSGRYEFRTEWIGGIEP
jgi:hypothetical protein